MKHLITLAACLTMTALLQSQTIIRVTPNGAGDGTSWTNANSLENAVKNATFATEIWVQKGTYQPSGMLTVQDSVKIYGGFAGTETDLSQRNFVVNSTIVDGQQEIGSIFRLENSAVIDGFTIQNGNAGGNSQKSGGGIWADENSVIKNCVITQNTASLNGGGVFANGKVTIINSTIKENTANGNGANTFGNCLVIETNKNDVSPNTIAGCNKGIPDFGEVSFKTGRIWTISGNGVEQEWSDVVMASNCTKTIYYGGFSGNYYSDCRANNPRATYGDWFSWCAVARFAHVLCPAPWRVPTTGDFVDLDKALGGTGTNRNGLGSSNAVLLKYVSSWGGAYGGNCHANGLLYQGSGAYYHSQTEGSSVTAYFLGLSSSGIIYPQYNGYGKDYGFTLRCIR